MNTENKDSKTSFKPDLGFVGTGALVGAGLAIVGSPTISFFVGLGLPQLGGNTADQKGSLFLGEAIGFIGAKALPGLVSSFVQNNPVMSLALGATAGIYYYKDDIYNSAVDKANELMDKTHELYDNTIGKFLEDVDVAGAHHDA